MPVRVSVVVPAYNAEKTLRECLHALGAQSLAREEFEIIVVDDGSRDRTAQIAEGFGAHVVRRIANGGPAAARNTGWQEAQGRWVAFTDADCVPARTWLAELLRVVESAAESPALGAAGRTYGYESNTPAARYVDLSGALDAERHLSHPRFPFAPSGNLMYRRDALVACGGFDERYHTYEACELHQRIRRRDGGRFTYAPRAVVLHRHRATWGAYWRQQYGYGIGYGQFMCHQASRIGWSFADELRAWWDVLRAGLGACRPGNSERRLFDRGTFVKRLAQRTAFDVTYWNIAERARW